MSPFKKYLGDIKSVEDFLSVWIRYAENYFCFVDKMSKQNVFITEFLKINIHLICVENINRGNHINKQITAFKG